ncbi:DNA-directed RNA polymerase subunit alpha C-terminal domain-containing protein [Pedobacter frigoris]|uniref:DNA-directed RNA polymerase subunit alpha C-terminal domain-containing protein n=1 Tax=Pedobacter frigoris TaxID=2571272 RepID=UPI0039772CD3
MNIKNYSIREVKEFSTRTKNALIQVGILYVRDLSRLHHKDLNMIYSIGEKGKRSIIEFCNKNSLMFSEQTFFTKRSF